MRSEEEVLRQLLTYAEKNEMIRAVLLNGSRVNPNVENDLFSDYDVIFAVTEPKYFYDHQDWIKHFGELIIMQQNTIQSEEEDWYIFLMIFTDGVRIDLSFRKIDLVKDYLEDSLTITLMDKDNLITDLSPPSDRSYYIKKPTKDEFEKTTNNFWWVSTYVAKGIWRDELPYAKYMLDVIVRDSLTKMISWYIGLNHHWEINAGLAGRWFERFLPSDVWESYQKIYAGGNYEEIWEALFEAGKLVNKIGTHLADYLGYIYPIKDDQQVTEFLHRIRSLSKDATSI